MSWKLFGKHQFGAVVATAVDFLVMIAWVELTAGSAVAGTAIGAATGACTNFLMGRRWIFRAHQSPASRQAFRYSLVAVGSLGLNSLGESLALKTGGLSYVVARVLVAGTVGLSWNYPMHRHFVFRTAAETPLKRAA